MKKAHVTVSDLHMYWQQYQSFVSAKRDESPGEFVFQSCMGCRMPYVINKVKICIQMHVFSVPVETAESDFFKMKIFMGSMNVREIVSLFGAIQETQNAADPFHPKYDELMLRAANTFVDIWNSKLPNQGC